MNKKMLIIISIFLVVVVGGILTFSFINKGTNENKEDNKQTESGELSSDEKLDEKVDSNKMLVLYFSQSGNTETIANFIKDYTNADILELETVKEYPSVLEELYKVGQEELDSNARPELKTKVDISKYDVIFIGYPIWGANLPMAWYSFFDEYDLSGKTLVPFTTHGGSGMSGTDGDIKREEPNAKVLKGYEVRGSEAKEKQSEVNDWLKQIGF